jgi:hypothetical protein
MSKIEDKVCEKIQRRAEFGLKKYGVTLERDDLTELEWLVHAQEEAMDLANYLEVLIQKKRKELYSQEEAEFTEFLKERFDLYLKEVDLQD